MKRVFIIGAGELGSRHLQALKDVNQNIDINVIDPSSESLDIAKERYEAIPGNQNNKISYNESINNIDSLKQIDIVIIATSSNVRSMVTIDLLNRFKVNTIIFEKILFAKKDDYFIIDKLLKGKDISAYVNCPMRTLSFYNNIKESFQGTKFKYLVSGSQYGLVTNLIHYLDHMSFLNHNTDYSGDTSFLEKELIKSKRKGFYELNGTFQVNFKNGTQGFFHCDSKGNSPIVVQAFNNKVHFISMESEGKVLISKAQNDWKWEEITFNIPFQSQLTTVLVESLFDNNTCLLPTYEESMKIHLPYLDSLLNFVNDNNELKFTHYPFT